MITGDGSYIKRFNRAIILEKIFKHKKISRADLAKLTGLNKATISAQVYDLLEMGYLTETKEEHQSIGRRPIMLSINKDAGYVLGIDLDFEKIQYCLFDLSGKLVREKREAVATDRYDEILQRLVKSIKAFSDWCKNSRYGLVNVVIGVHGIVRKDEVISFIPKLQWRNTNLKEDLKKSLSMDIHIDNNANLSAYAEKVYEHYECRELLNLIITSGIGAGMINGNDIYRGYNGYAGETGHMVIYPDGEQCRCGNRGCWELYASESSLLRKMSVYLRKDHLTISDLEKRIIDNEPVVMTEIDKFLKNLAIGINNIINMYNPELLILTSDILPVIPDAVEKIKANLHSKVSQYRKILLSRFGNRSCVMGACARGIQSFFGIESLVLADDGT